MQTVRAWNTICPIINQQWPQILCAAAAKTAGFIMKHPLLTLKDDACSQHGRPHMLTHMSMTAAMKYEPFNSDWTECLQISLSSACIILARICVQFVSQACLSKCRIATYYAQRCLACVLGRIWHSFIQCHWTYRYAEMCNSVLYGPQLKDHSQWTPNKSM